MLFVFRSSPGYLALARTNEDAGLLVMLAGPHIAMPDNSFWPLIEAKGFGDEMRTENPERWDRMVFNGVGALSVDKEVLLRSGLNRGNAHSKAPTPGTYEEA